MSKVDPGGELAKLLEGVTSKHLASASVAFPCRVISYDPLKCVASVQPLIQLTNDPPSPIQNVPMLGQKARIPEHSLTILDGTERIITVREHELSFVPNVEAGDIVYVVCADRKMGKATAGEVSKPDSDRNHNRNDAVIVGVFPCSL